MTNIQTNRSVAESPAAIFPSHRVMKLALVAPLPPCPSPWARVATALIPQFEEGGVEVFVEHPFWVRPNASELAPVKAMDELAPALGKGGDQGGMDVPVYFMSDDIHHLDQLRFIVSCPGIVVLEKARLDQLASQLFVSVHGGEPKPFFGGLRDVVPGDGISLARAIARASRAVVVPHEAARGALEGEAGSAVLHVVPELTVETEKVEAAAQALLEIAELLPDAPVAAERVPEPGVQVVIVSYNSRDLISPCLESLLAQDYSNLEITVVDNASADGTAAFVRENFPTVNVIESKKNLGFAGGCNLGFTASSSRYVALLNQDALARKNWITELVRVAELDPRVAGVGSKLLMDRCPTILNSTGIEINEAGWAWDRQVGERDEDPSPLPQEVFGVCGGALLYRRDAIEAVGGFDRRYFMYFEDTDLCWRLRLNGQKVFYAPLAVVRHDFHGDSGATPGRLLRRRYMSERNRLQTLVKNADWRSLKAVFPRILRHERGRMKAYRANARRGNAPDFHRDLMRIVRRTWTWNLLRLPSLLWRRFQVQRTVKSRSGVTPFIMPGINEGGHQGDVSCFHDRYSARSSTAIVMGDSDNGCLGSGWHTVEQPPGAVQAYRWCKARSWFYLTPESGHGRLILKVASPIAPNTLRVYAENEKIGEAAVDADVRELAFDLPGGLPHGGPWEFRLGCDIIRPADNNPGGDIRDLGLILFEMRLE